jgi:alpha-L-rhamnosidase
MKAERLKCEYLYNPIGIDMLKPILTWNVKGGAKQTAYEIKTELNGSADWESGIINSSSMHMQYGGTLKSRDIVTWKLRVFDEKGCPGEWSEEQNLINFIVGDGWFKGKLGCDGDEYLFGRQTKLMAQLEITYEDGSRDIVTTDNAFKWCNDGPVLQNDLKDGICIDTRKNPSYMQNVQETSYSVFTTASNAPAIKEHERFTPKLIITPSGCKVLDFGQNIAGYVSFTARGESGRKVILRLGETLDNDEFTQENFTTLPDRGKAIEQKIEIILNGETFENYPKFFFSGFRYAMVEGQDVIKVEDFTAIAIYSDMEFTGEFNCSNEKINKFVQNTIWSEKGNFVDIPTDCPQREKAGWTGDAQVFAKIATYLADTAAFFRKWLKDVRDCQREDGRVENVCPKVQPMGPADAMNGSTGWADAAVIIPYTLWKMYEDASFIIDNYQLMQGWKEYVINSAADKSLHGIFRWS